MDNSGGLLIRFDLLKLFDNRVEKLTSNFANDGCQSWLQSTGMGSHPLLLVDVKCLLQSMSMGSHSFLMMDVKVYYNQHEYIATFAESIRICKFYECIPENFLIIWVLTNYLHVNAQWMYS